MKVCTKCKIEKELDQYYKYFHSSQQKWRVRGECTDCFYNTRLNKKNPDLIYQNNPEYKKCRTCELYVHYDGYYHHSSKKKTNYIDCRKCCNKKETDKRRIEREQTRIDNGGSTRIKQNPNEYLDIHQREQTFMIMEVLGYTYHEDTGDWTKPGVKEFIDGKLVFLKIKKKCLDGKTN